MPDAKEPDWEELLVGIKSRYTQLAAKSNTDRVDRFLEHVKNLRTWEAEEVTDYPNISAAFPETIHIAFAVCHSACGVQEFIVDGGTQACQRCGRNLFRLETQTYRKAIS